MGKINRKFIIIPTLLAVLFFLPHMIGNVHWTRVFIECYIWMVVCLGFRLILRTGELSLAQVAFMGVGAYTVALLTTRLGWNFWICFVLAGIITALMALIIGFISLRTKGFYFAIATFAIAEVIRLTWIEWSSVFGGVGGIANIPPPDPILGFKFGSVLSFYYLSLLLIIVTTFIMHCLEVSRFGLIVTTFEEADDLAESVGINVTLYKNISYVIGSFFAGCAGAIFGPFYHYIGPDDFSVQQSFYIVIYILAGGADSVYGTLIGVFVIMVTLTLVHLIPGYNPVWEPLVLGSILLIIMKVLPGGLLSLVQKTSF